MSVTRTALCTVKGCPAPKDPDWHKPWCRHGTAGEHQHWPKRSQGGKRIVAFLCHDCHDRIDNGDWGNSVVTTNEDGKKVEIYRAWDLHNKTIIEQIIGINDALSDGAEEGTGEASPVLTEPSASSLKEESDVGVQYSVDAGLGVGVSDGDSGAHASSLTHDQRVAIAAKIKDTEWNRQWVAGDTANAWRAELGEEAEQYISDFGYVQESIANIMYACEQIPPAFRNAALRFSHHLVVLGLNREDMDEWLDKCVEEGWSVAEFRRQVKGERPRVKRWTLEELEKEQVLYYASNQQPKTVHGFLAWITPVGEQG